MIKNNFTFQKYKRASAYWLKGHKEDKAFAQAHPLLIYNMSKVGSTSIYEALQKRFGLNQVFHFHFLTNNLVDLRLSSDVHHRLNYRKVLPYLRYRQKNSHKKPFIITAIRDPLAREVSSIYQIQTTAKEPLPEVTQQWLKGRFNLKTIRYSLNWFEFELRATFGMDLTQLSFTPEKGYAIYENDAAKVLLLKLEQMPKNIGVAFKEFTSLAPLKIGKSNTSSAKDNLSVSYQEFRKSIKFERSFLEQFYQHPFCMKYFTPQEIERFIKQWQV